MELDPLLNKVPEKIEHIHILGICGTGMAALAGMLQSLGYRISGSDQQVYPPMSDFLVDLGVHLHQPYSAKNLSQEPDLVIIGNVIRRSNEEALEVGRRGLPYLSFPQALAHFFIRSRSSLVITGTHGKTTTCSLLASVLYHAKLDPTFMIGGIVREFNSNFRLGKGKYFVAEGDEYDTAFFDKESKFLHYRPQIAVITSLEFDHADIFADLEQIKRAFAKFIQLLPPDGLLIANLDNPDIAELAQAAPCPVEGYGLNSSFPWSLGKISSQSGYTHFEVLKDGTLWDSFTVALPGQHNCLNSLAVCAIMHHLGLDTKTINQGLVAFGGVKRRQEIRGIENNITVIDDFAHHPTAVRETLAALKAAYPQNRLVTVFEPRTNSSRRTIFQKQYSESFDSSNIVLLREPVPLVDYPADQLFSSKQLTCDLKKRGLKAASFANTDQILLHLKSLLQPGDVVAILSNGGFDNIHVRLLESLREN
ncbi:UDP-N-acetylmuramate:L-alanyl-gamma-D-glutamyl-meso-diaminopimelate ligase [Desulfotalea psychrophila]|uniref:UDP-N-acetylmuramate--L-alanine ligase n=1 Tax=Desulfotalea psychrophila (strain LSv54 / DSM 12343) TaxID=177439 RepID=Q6AJ21_DESPS|nr:UDP-N-acetylmuramate:L-alanyl-gamma-D-glutamyl-meso-diaminopimelate ligase [Desulfotalea psychrophila]CAG37659.1 probable UDP-N-acetylmuramate:L-alanyl-gamma-D-glutamyl-meso-diaminopimelate ligase [Desulfotalea psychrophila LSv54]